MDCRLGRIIEYNGKEASGKTLSSLMSIAAFQKQGYKCAFIDGEQTITEAFARNQGVNWDDLILTQPDTLEQALEIIELLICSGEVSLIVFDSVAALPTITEERDKAGEVKVASIAKVLTSALRKFTPLTAKNDCSIILINQMREKIGVFSPSGRPVEDSPGGPRLETWLFPKAQVFPWWRTRIKFKERTYWPPDQD